MSNFFSRQGSHALDENTNRCAANYQVCHINTLHSVYRPVSGVAIEALLPQNRIAHTHMHAAPLVISEEKKVKQRGRGDNMPELVSNNQICPISPCQMPHPK